MKSMAEVRTYKIWPIIPWCGAVGLAFWLYVCLYAWGLLSWILFPKVSGFRPPDSGTTLFLLVMLVLSAWLIGSARIRVVITPDWITYCGYFRITRIDWREVRRMTRHPHLVDICLWSERDYIRFGRYLGRKADLPHLVEHYVKKNAPDAQIVQARPPLLPQWKG